MRNFDSRPQRILLPAKVGFIALSVLVALALNLLPWGDFPAIPDSSPWYWCSGASTSHDVWVWVSRSQWA